MSPPNPPLINTHGVRINYGRHQGELYTRIPIGYLKWMVCNRCQEWEVAEAELARREVVTPTIEVSGHAIDRFSQRFLTIWEEHRQTANGTYEGLHAFLVRHGERAAAKAKFLNREKVEHLGIKWAFALDGAWPVLKSVM